jgi:hypothetical protein
MLLILAITSGSRAGATLRHAIIACCEAVQIHLSQSPGASFWRGIERASPYRLQALVDITPRKLLYYHLLMVLYACAMPRAAPGGTGGQ